MTRRVCAATSPSTIEPVAGSRAIWPEAKSRWPARIACEYGPIAWGASGLETDVFAMSRMALCRLHHLVRSQTAGADANSSGAAVHDGADGLQVGLEAARAHVVRMTVLASDHRALAADLTTLSQLDPPCPSMHQDQERQRTQSPQRRLEISFVVFVSLVAP